MKNLIILALALLTLALIPSALAVDIPVSASVSKYISVTFSYTALDFGSVTSPSTDNKPVNLNQTAGELNVTTDTNSNYTVKMNGTDFSGPQTIAISNVEAKISNNLTDIVNKVSPTTLSTTAQTLFSKTVTTPGTQPTEYYGYWLDIPSSVLGGSYSSTITILHETT